jgi:hypothetical protein
VLSAVVPARALELILPISKFMRTSLLFKFGLTLIGAGCALALASCSPPKFYEVVQPQFKSQPDCGFVQNVYGERISWKDKLPIAVNIHESVPVEFRATLIKALTSWETTAGRKLFDVREVSASGPIEPRQDGANVIYFMNQWEAQKSTEQARTSVYWVGDQIKEFDIRLNAKDFKFYTEMPQNGLEVHLLSLMIHEVGHALGLKHRDTSPSVMGTYLASNFTRDQLTPVDRQSFACEY